MATCGSCGRDGERVIAVRRTYVTPETEPTAGSDHTLEDVEHWCYACCVHYPHVPAE